MKRLRVPLAVTLGLLVLTGFVSASAGSGLNEPLKVLATAEIGIPGTAPMDIAFERDLLVTATIGSLDPQQDETLKEGKGVGIFRVLDRAPWIKKLGFHRCATYGDVAVWRRWVFAAVWNTGLAQNSHSSKTCNNTNDSTGKAGLRIVDIADPARPKQVGFIESKCGVAYLTVVRVQRKVYVYNGGSCDETTATPVATLSNGEMEVYRFFPKDPARSRLVNKPNLLPMLGCEVIPVVMSRRLGACSHQDGRFVLLDLSDPAQPEPIGEPTVVPGATLSFSHFTWDGQYLLVGDSPYEGRSAAGCSGTDADPAVYVYNVEDTSSPALVGTWRPSRTTPDEPGCVAGNIQPLPTRDGSYVFSIAYAGRGVYIVDFTDPTAPVEIAAHRPSDPAFFFSAHWYNGRIYASDMWNVASHLYVMQPPRELNRPLLSFFPRLNVQTLVEGDLVRE